MEKTASDKANATAKKPDRAQLLEELKKAREELQALQKSAPVLPVLRVDDDTPEMMALELVKQGGRLLAASPEARTLENITRYTDDANVDVFLKGHAGDDLRSGRVSRGRDSVDRPALTCAFSPQPCVLQGMAESEDLRGRGFFARWLYGIPRSGIGYRQVSPPPPAVPSGVRNRYCQFVVALWKTEPDGERPYELRFAPGAASELTAFLVWVEERLRPGGTFAGLAGWGNKLGGLCVRLCGILHAADGVASGSAWTAEPISAAVVQRAIRICKEYAGPHALAAFDLMGTSERVVKARRVLKWVRDREGPTADFTKRDAFNGCRAWFNQVAEMEPALELLEQHYLIRPKDRRPRSGPGRKPSPVYEVNPAAFQDEPPAHNSHITHNGPVGHPDTNSAHCANCARVPPPGSESAFAGAAVGSGPVADPDDDNESDVTTAPKSPSLPRRSYRSNPAPEGS